MKKEIVKNQSAYNVTFNYDVVPQNPVESVLVLGDFNEWSFENGYKLKKNKHGDFEGTFKIPAGRDYHFRYLVNGVRWANEKDADRYEASPIHAHIDNSVLSLPALSVANNTAKTSSNVKPGTDGDASKKKEGSQKTAVVKKSESSTKSTASSSSKSTSVKNTPAKKAALKEDTTKSSSAKAGTAKSDGKTASKSSVTKKAASSTTGSKTGSAKSTSDSASKSATKAKKDDLTKIEGIGPKIAELLGKAGVDSFATLAESKKSNLSQILDAAGTKFAVHDPTTWPQQAKLADAGKWDQLAKLQVELKGGKK